MKKINNYIDGNIVEGSSTNYIPVDNPATGEVISKVIQSDIKDFENTVSSSVKAFEIWSQVTPLKRSRIISKYKELIEKDLENLVK